MLVPIDDILFHKGAHKHKVKLVPRPKFQDEVFNIATSKRAEAEAIRCAIAIVAGKERQLLPHLPNINHVFPPTWSTLARKVILAPAARGNTRKRLVVSLGRT